MLTDAGVSWKFYWVDGGMRSQTSYWKAFQDAPTSSPLYINSRKSQLGQFEYDALHDRLPTVSWLFPGPGQDEHPNSSSPAAGAQFIAGAIGWVCGEPFDHTSSLRFLEAVTGVECTNISAWRRRTFGDLTSAFRFQHRPADPPRQAPGRRPVTPRRPHH